MTPPSGLLQVEPLDLKRFKRVELARRGGVNALHLRASFSSAIRIKPRFGRRINPVRTSLQILQKAAEVAENTSCLSAFVVKWIRDHSRN